MKALPLVPIALCVTTVFAQPTAPAARPKLHARLEAGPGDISLDQLVKNLEWTGKNLSNLVFYLEPFNKTAPASGADAEWAQAALVQESAACDRFIEAGDQLLAKGIVRRKPGREQDALTSLMGHASWGMRIRRNPTAALAQRDVSIAQANVAGHMASLIRSRSLDYRGWAERETNYESWLASARKSLEGARKQLAEARLRER